MKDLLTQYINRAPVLAMAIALATALVPLSAAGQVRFESVSDGIPRTEVKCFVRSNDGTLVMGSTLGVYRMEEGSDEWSFVSMRINVFTLATSPTGTLLAGTGLGTYRSTDDGLTWTNVFNTVGMTDYVFPGEDLVFASDRIGGSEYHYRSTDDGQTWSITTIPFRTGPNPNLVLTPDNRLLYTSPQGVVASNDNGDTWEIIFEPGSEAPLSKLVSSGNTLAMTQVYQYGQSILLESTDGGSAWNSIDTAYITGLYPTEGDRYYITISDTIFDGALRITPNESSGLYLRDPDGAPGESYRNVLPTAKINTVYYDGTNTWTGYNFVPRRSADGVKDWQTQTNGLRTPHINSVATGSEGAIFLSIPQFRNYGIGSFQHMLYRSTDLGDTWEQVWSGMSEDPIVTDDFGNLYATADSVGWRQNNGGAWKAVSYKRLYISRDNGDSWEKLYDDRFSDVSSNTSAGSVAIGFQSSDGTGDMLYSTDRGTTWQALSESVWTTPETSRAVDRLQVLRDGSILFSVVTDNPASASSGTGLYHRTSETPEGTKIFNAKMADMYEQADGTVIGTGNKYAQGGTGMYKSNDDGTQWGIKEESSLYVYWIQALGAGTFVTGGSPGYPNTYISHDGGDSWATVTTPGGVSLNRPIRLDDWTFLSTIPTGLVRSTDGGDSWKVVEESGLTEAVRVSGQSYSAILPPVAQSGYVFYPFENAGLYRSNQKISAAPEAPRAQVDVVSIEVRGNGSDRTIVVEGIASGSVRVELVDILGRTAATLTDGTVGNDGTLTLPLSIGALPGGTYLMVVRSRDRIVSEPIQIP